MKKIKLLLPLFLLLITSTLVAQNNKHLWQLKSQPPNVFLNHNGQMSVFTYDRLSIYNVESGKIEKTFDFLANRSPYIWPTKGLIYYAEDFKNYNFYGQNKNISGNRGKYVRFFVDKEKWEDAAIYDYPLDYKYTDIQGREVVSNSKKKSVWLYKPNGKKIKEILNADYVNGMDGGKFGYYRKDNVNYIVDFTTDIIRKIDINGYAWKLDKFPEWLVYKDVNKRTLFNPHTNQIEIKEENDSKNEIPNQYHNCLKFRNSNVVYFGKYVYKIIIDEAKMTEPDVYKAVPYAIEQYNASDCSLVKTFEISVTEAENSAKLVV